MKFLRTAIAIIWELRSKNQGAESHFEHEVSFLRMIIAAPRFLLMDFSEIEVSSSTVFPATAIAVSVFFTQPLVTTLRTVLSGDSALTTKG